MKAFKLTIQAVLMITVLTIYVSCERWDITGIKGHGDIVTKNLDIQEVKGIIIEIPATVYLTQGDEQSIRIEAQQNILDNMERYINNDVLKLKFDQNVSNCEPIKIYMTIKNLKEIGISGSGNVRSDSKFVSDGNLSIDISGSGSVQVEDDAQTVYANISGSGEITLSTVCETFYGNISGSGSINLENGLANYAEFKSTGSGGIFAYNFPVEECKINMAGSGDSKVNVTNKLNISIAGSGDVYYKGNPQLSVSVAGSGKVVNSN